MTYHSTVTSKGQTTIPKEVREKLNLPPGADLDWTVEEGQAVVRPRTGSILDLAGMLYRPGQGAATIEEMNAAIAEAAIDSAMAGLPRSK